MNTQDILEVVNGRKGQFITLTTQRECKVKKGCNPIFKRSTYQMRVGHNYNNQSKVIKKHESGEREKLGLPDYLERVNDYIVRHRSNNTEYLTGQPSGNKGIRQFLDANGNELNFQDIESFLYSSEKGNKDDDQPDHIRVKTESILSIK